MSIFGFLLILFELGFGLKFNLIGEISISEIFLLLYGLLILPNFFKSKNSHIRFLLYIYMALLISQIISELAVSNSFSNSLKGMAITVVSFFHFVFLVTIFLQDLSNVQYILLGIIFRYIIFGSEIYADESIASIVETNSDAKFLKFYIAPLVSNILLYVSLKLKQKILGYLFVIISLCLIALGSRSMGLMLLFSIVLVYGIGSIKKINISFIISFILVLIIVLYPLYVLYVNAVLSGNITAGNSMQILSLNNPYNPFELLLYGRFDFYASLIAFLDSPIFGYGAWSKDTTGYYNYLLVQISHVDIPQYLLRGKGMPMHSVILGYGVMNGFLALSCVCALIFSIVKKGFCSFKQGSVYNYVMSYFLVALLWNSLFSPLSHFRLSLPLYMSFLFVIYLKRIYEKKMYSC